MITHPGPSRVLVLVLYLTLVVIALVVVGTKVSPAQDVRPPGEVGVGTGAAAD